MTMQALKIFIVNFVDLFFAY